MFEVAFAALHDDLRAERRRAAHVDVRADLQIAAPAEVGLQPREDRRDRDRLELRDDVELRHRPGAPSDALPGKARTEQLGVARLDGDCGRSAGCGIEFEREPRSRSASQGAAAAPRLAAPSRSSSMLPRQPVADAPPRARSRAKVASPVCTAAT